MRWPDHIPAGTTSDMMLMTIDILPTLAHLIGARLPDHKIDGLNVWPVISGDASNPHDFYAFYYESGQLQAITSNDGKWKLQLPHTYRTLGGEPGGKGGIPAKYKNVKLEQAELYDLYTDISESQNMTEKNPDMVQKLQGYAEKMRAELGDAITKREGSGVRGAGK
jgi:arylsulfatase